MASLPSPPLLHLPRRTLLSLSASTLSPPLPSLASSSPDTTIRHRVFMEFSICPSFFNNCNLGDMLSSCKDSESIVGRLVLGLYGYIVPLTVSNFRNMCTSSSYKGTLVHKLLPGQYFVAGRQRKSNKGKVRVPENLARNTVTVDSKAFLLQHSRPGTVSLCLSENDDDDDIKLDSNYRNVEFLITTGPGPCPDLDNKNIVFGTVLEGMDVVTTIASIPIIQTRRKCAPIQRVCSASWR